ncbi:hypothetical protein TrCOL_g8856 [Triparma columacea]|uniref:Uncharacterized protein n=1 Tax=Triparma columacea TaxID=722753 RepID=A0A9W7GDS9_9STRA|nr:hypothetical protein TrCOL_g8856 [Triparma columacea]
MPASPIPLAPPSLSDPMFTYSAPTHWVDIKALISLPQTDCISGGAEDLDRWWGEVHSEHFKVKKKPSEGRKSRGKSLGKSQALRVAVGGGGGGGGAQQGEEEDKDKEELARREMKLAKENLENAKRVKEDEERPTKKAPSKVAKREVRAVKRDACPGKVVAQAAQDIKVTTVVPASGGCRPTQKEEVKGTKKKKKRKLTEAEEEEELKKMLAAHNEKAKAERKAKGKAKGSGSGAQQKRGVKDEGGRRESKRGKVVVDREASEFEDLAALLRSHNEQVKSVRRTTTRSRGQPGVKLVKEWEERTGRNFAGLGKEEREKVEREIKAAGK